MVQPLFGRIDELRLKWDARLRGSYPTSTEDLETWVEELRWVFDQGEWMEEGLKLAAVDQEGTARWLESLEGPMSPEMFYERFPEAKPEMMCPPAEHREFMRQCHLARLAGLDPFPDSDLKLREKFGYLQEKYGHLSGGNSVGPGSWNGGAAVAGARKAGADIGCQQVAGSQEAGGGDGRVPVAGSQELPACHVADWNGAVRAVTVMASGAQPGPSFAPSGVRVSGSETVGAVPMPSGVRPGPSVGPSGTHGSGPEEERRTRFATTA
ncbi:MAG: hypothetical protein LBT40_18135 [Deltaproteobacteria bacterium]|jgi:hypothetical protein|nr:hypothetical protein [Deltaproteobacteria bacterium]